MLSPSSHDQKPTEVDWPVEIDVKTPGALITATGAFCWLVLPLPRSPEVPSPQQKAFPFWMAQVCVTVSDILVTPEVMLRTAVGDFDTVVVPLPFSPYGFSPQHCNPPLTMAHA
jgi:hypothetical protein